MEYTNSQIKEIISEWIHSARDREINIRRYTEGMTYEQLAEVFDMSVSQIKRIIYRDAFVIFRHIPP